MNHEDTEYVRAETLIVHELIDALLYENSFGLADRAVVLDQIDALTGDEFDIKQSEIWLSLPLGEQALLLRARQDSPIQPYRLSRAPVVLLDPAAGSWRVVGPLEVLRLIAESLSPQARAALPNLDGFQADLEAALSHTTILLEASAQIVQQLAATSRPTLLDWERLAALRDRPFHPSARAKSGWSEDEFRRFGSLPDAAFGLDWLAVRRDHIQGGAELSIAETILDDEDRERLRASYAAAGIAGDDYVALPVHPWQMAQVLPTLYAAELRDRVCVPLALNLGSFAATSSARSLVPLGDDSPHVKVPLGISALGALRVLPPRYQRNAARSQSLLEALIALDPEVGRRLWLCDERQWLAFHDPAADPFADKPGHLGCLLRAYPAALLQDPSIELLPMAALSVVTAQGTMPAVEHLLRARGDGAQVTDLFREVAHTLIDVALRCFRYGIMPELHGQNVVLVTRHGRIDGLLLRDHDTVRLHLPWLLAAGLPDPDYLVKPGTPNSLINDAAEDLLIYFQTLAVQVNLHAIADGCATANGIELAQCWQTIHESIATTLALLPEPARSVGRRVLLEAPAWPTKLLLVPLLERVGTGGGSMPSGYGSTSNPLHVLADRSVLAVS
ncbi:MAG TPA: IucA/IucC family protein [Herpetosiphonaceae bacterium]